MPFPRRLLFTKRSRHTNRIIAKIITRSMSIRISAPRTVASVILSRILGAPIGAELVSILTPSAKKIETPIAEIKDVNRFEVTALSLL